MTEPVRYAFEHGVARITLDDGRVNVMSLAMLQAIEAALDRADADEAIVLLRSARPVFSAGFDLKVFASGDAAASQAMVRAGAELALRLLTRPWPVVGVCEGHAYPMGAFLLLASDVRIGTLGDWRIGLNEVAIGIAVPTFALELARSRLTPAAVNLAAVTGRMVGPQEALDAGFVDRLVPPGALEAEIAATLDQLRAVHRPSHASTKQRLRAATAAAMRAAIDGEQTLATYAGGGVTAIRLPA